MSQPIRVLQMISSLYVGGSQTMIVNLYKNIDRTKIQFDFVIDHSDYDDLKETIESLGGIIYVIPTFNGNNIKEVVKAWDSLFLNHPEYRILHSHSRSHASLYLPVAKKHGVITIIHSHNTSNGKGVKALVKNILQYPLRYQADYFFGCSKDSGKWLFGEKVANSDKFFVLPNAIDAEKFRFNEETRIEYRKKFKIEDKQVFIQVGSLSEQKNHIFTIEVFKRFCDLNSNCILFLVGVGNKENEIINKIKEYNLTNKIILLGRRNDISELLQMSDCFIMPSLYEGLSVAAIEAQASGVKCLLSDTVSKDVKISEQTEFLPLDVNSWVIAMNNNYNHVDIYKQIIDCGYDIKDTSKWIQDFYMKIWGYYAVR